MNTNFLGAAAVTTAMLASAPAYAATVLIIDDFTVAQSVQDSPSNDPAIPVTSTLDIGGGVTRTLTAENAQPGNTTLGQTNLTSGTNPATGEGSLSFSNASGATGIGTLTYTGLGDIQFDDDPSRSFFTFAFLPFDFASQFSATATDNGGGESTFTETLTGDFSPTLFFSEFAGTADFNDIDTLTFVIDSENLPALLGPQTNVDGALTSISVSAVPLPAAGFLLFGALGGMAALRRRKTRKAA